MELLPEELLINLLCAGPVRVPVDNILTVSRPIETSLSFVAKTS